MAKTGFRKRGWLIAVAALLGAIVIGAVLDQGRRLDPEDTFADPQAIEFANALLDGDHDRLAALVAEGADINVTGKDGITLLQWEIMRESLRNFQKLLDLGADPDQIGWHGQTAVHLAAQYSSTAYLEILLDAGADVNVASRRMGESPLFNALATRRSHNVDLLLERGADLEHATSSGVRPLKYASTISDSDHVWQFLQLGADPEATDDLGTTFQSSFFRANPAIMTETARRNRENVIAFLTARDIPLHPNAFRHADGE